MHELIEETSRQGGRTRVLAAPASQRPDGNPYINQLGAAVAAQGIQLEPMDRAALLRGAADVVHVHWPESLVRWGAGLPTATSDVVKTLVSLWVARRRGAKVVWSGHNLEPHDQRWPALSRVFLRTFGALTDLVISFGPAASDALRQRHSWVRGRPVVVIPHGHYRACYAAPGPQAEARDRLGLDRASPTLLMMGQLRRYKGVTALVSAYEARFADRATLLVAGSAAADPGLETDLRTRTGPAGRTVLRFGTVPHEDVPLLHAAADVVVLPYAARSVLNSGAAILSLSMGRPVVVPDSPTMRELQAQVGADWVHTFDGDVDAALDLACTVATRSRSSAPDLSSLEWEPIGRATAQVYRDLAHGVAG